MEQDSKTILEKTFEKELLKENPEDLQKANMFSKIMYSNSKEFMALIEAFKTLDKEDGTNYLETLPPILFSSIAISATEDIDSAIGLLYLWAEKTKDILADCDKKINTGK